MAGEPDTNEKARRPVIAERAGKSDQASAFRTATDEETKDAEETAAVIEPVARTYLDLTPSGSKADSRRTGAMDDPASVALTVEACGASDGQSRRHLTDGAACP
ncbi:MAG: hypothetical protein WAP03_22340 [Methylorubrum rhodinum]|uniref:hypothetical protein n=1 Tax=Methylorubrum rhodinum TaxID=29428 RepID=UPI003BAF2C08